MALIMVSVGGVFEGLNRREAHLLQEYHAAIIQSGYVQYG